MDRNGAGSAPHDALLVDTGVLRIEELKGPDQLPDHNKKLQGYGDARGALQPTTGDQGVDRGSTRALGLLPCCSLAAC